MSTRIYDARRFPLGTLNEFLSIVRKYALQEAEKYVEELIPLVDKAQIDKQLQDAIGRMKEKPDEAKLARMERYYRVDFLWEKFKEGAKQPRKSVFDLECGWNLWIHRGFVYAIPWGVSWAYRDIKLPEWAKDYSYWDNWDRPDDVTTRAWKRRCKVWGLICLEDHDRTRLVHTILDLHDWQQTACRLLLKLQGME